jgi:hypothetical protein
MPLARRLPLALLVAFWAGCAHSPPPSAAPSGVAGTAGAASAPRLQSLEAAGGQFALEFGPRDSEAAALVVRAVEAALPRLQRWGRLRERVVIKVLPDHDALEQAVDKRGYSWLRAWARYAVVYVQSPASWLTGSDAQAQADELLLHELTHCLMYQRSGGDPGWQEKGIPLWFREGMASVTAGQGYRRGTLGSLASQVRAGEELIADAEGLYRQKSEVVYAAAHHAFEFLLRRHGDEGVRRVLDTMGAGRRFDAAFEEALGVSRTSFERQFRNFISMARWR